MSSRDSYVGLLESAENSLGQIWNVEEQRVPSNALSGESIDQAVRLTLGSIAAAKRLAVEGHLAGPTKAITLRYTADRTVVIPGQGEQTYPEIYKVQAVIDSIAFHPGQKIDGAQVALLVESEEWKVTLVEG